MSSKEKDFDNAKQDCFDLYMPVAKARERLAKCKFNIDTDLEDINLIVIADAKDSDKLIKYKERLIVAKRRLTELREKLEEWGY